MTSRGGQPDEMSSLGRHVTLAFGSGNMTYLGMTFRQVAPLVGHYFYNVFTTNLRGNLSISIEI